MVRASKQQRRNKGTVLVMVIGLLSMLFVLGSSFLFVSRFEKQIAERAAEQIGQPGTDGTITFAGGPTGRTGGGPRIILRSLRNEIQRQLRLDVVGADGIPYNADLDGATGTVREDSWDTPGWFDIDANAFPFLMDPAETGPGDIPRTRAIGFAAVMQAGEIGDGLLAANEPYPDPLNINAMTGDPLWTWSAVSSFADNNPRLSHQVVQYPDITALNWWLPWFGLPNFSLSYGAWSFRYDLIHERPSMLDTEELVPDADGDGYPDFLFATLHRDGDNRNTTTAPPSELWPDEQDWESWASRLSGDQKVALRVIAHGGMVLLDDATPESLLVAATDRFGSGATNHIRWPRDNADLNPVTEEANLRRRNCLPTPDDKRTQFEEDNERWLRSSDGNGNTKPRWVPFEYDFDQQADGDSNIPDTVDQEYFQDAWMTPPSSVDGQNLQYDRRHLVTTVSYDDLYRPSRHENVLSSKLADWYDPTGDIQAGVLRRIGPLIRNVPLGYLPDRDLRPRDSKGNRLAGYTKFSLADLDETQSVYSKGDQIRLLYVFYRAMLEYSQVRLVGGGSDLLPNRSEQAAMLAVNTWDFFDSNDTPTLAGPFGDDLSIIDLDVPSQRVVYLETNGLVMGAEKAFPFISEVIAERDYKEKPAGTGDFVTTANRYAVELFNPWDRTLKFGGSNPYDLLIGTSPVNALLVPALTIDPAVQVGRVNTPPGKRNLLVISSTALSSGASGVPMPLLSLDEEAADGDTAVVLYARLGATGPLFAIDEVKLRFKGTDPPDREGAWPVPDPSDKEDDTTEVRSLARTLSLQKSGPLLPYTQTDWRFHLGIEEGLGGALVTPETVNATTHATTLPARAVPIYFNNNPDRFNDDPVRAPLQAFPSTGALLLVSRYANITRIPIGGISEPIPSSTLLTEQVQLQHDSSNPITAPWKKIDHGHMPVFDQQQWASMNDPPNDVPPPVRVPWGQMVYEYFTAMPLMRLRLDGTPNDYDGNDDLNDPQASRQDFRDDYEDLLERLNGDLRIVDNVGLPMPVVERVPVGGGEFAYGPKVRGRININVAPWSVLDGVPLVQYFNTSEVGPVLEIDQALGRILNVLPRGPIEQNAPGEFTITETLAQTIVAYREARQVFANSANFTGRLDNTDPGKLLDNNGDGVFGMGARNDIVPTVSIRSGPGFVTVGELANLVSGRRLGVYTAGDSAYRIDAHEGTDYKIGGTFDDYTHAIAVLASLPEWITVRSNTYTVYATLADNSGDELERTRAQWTLDRSRCLYTPSKTRAGLPQLIGREVILDYNAAQNDPR